MTWTGSEDTCKCFWVSFSVRCKPTWPHGESHEAATGIMGICIVDKPGRASLYFQELNRCKIVPRVIWCIYLETCLIRLASLPIAFHVVCCVKQNMRSGKAAVLTNKHTHTHTHTHTHLDDYDIYFFAMKEARCCRYSVARLRCSTGLFYWIIANGDQSDVTVFTGSESTWCLWTLLVCGSRMSCEVQLLDTVNN